MNIRFVRVSLLILPIAGVFLGLTACKPKDTTKRGPAAIPVQTAVALRQDLPITQYAVGNVQPLRTVAIRSQVDGTIKQIHFHEGDEVKTGDLLVTIDQRPFINALDIAKADLMTARAQSDSAKADFARYQNLDQASLVTKEEYEQYRTKAETAQAALAAKEAAVANAELQLSYTEIRAPIDGRTGQFGLHTGALVKAGDTTTSLLVINQLSPIAVAYSVPEAILPNLRIAMAPGNSIRVAAVPRVESINKTSATIPVDNENNNGRLTFIDNTVDPTTGMILLKAVFANTAHDLWPGQFVNVTMQLGIDPNAIVVPSAAVQNGQNQQQVFVVSADKTVQLRPVKVGRSANGLTVILDGVHENEVVVIDGQLRLTSGASVEVKSLDSFLKPPAKANIASAE